MKQLFMILMALFLAFSLVFADTEVLADQPAQPANQVSLGRAPNVQSVYPFHSTFFNSRSVNGPAYGLDALAYSWMRIPLNNPAGATGLGALPNDLFGGDFGPGGVFYAVDYTNNQLVTVDTLTGALTVVGSMPPVASGQAWTGIGWDASSSTMYAVSTDITTSYLSTVDIATGAVTVIGSTTVAAGLIDIGVDNFGNIYGHDIVSDAIYTIDPATGAATMLGATGFDANYAQGMDFNPETGELYLAAYNNTVGAAELRLVDLSTGAATLIGPIGAGSGMEVTAFGIAGNAGQDLDPKPPTGFTAYSDYTTPTGMLLTWTDPTEYVNGTPLTNFTIEIERDGSFIASVPMGTQTYTDAGLVDGTVYSYDIYAKDTVDSTSTKVNASWTAGGAAKPNPPAALSITNPGGGQLMAHWTNPATNIDGTPMDDFDAINLYENGALLVTFTRSPADTGKADSALFTPTGPNLPYYATALDNETPANESDASNTAFPPYSAPYLEDFEGATPGTPGTLPNLWTNETDDDFDWYVHQGGTGSLNTGPEMDHTTGTASGIYVYTESSSPNYPNKIAHLTTPFVDLSGVSQPGLSFWYHMYGAAMGELHVDVYYNGAWVLDVMPPIVGQQQASGTDPYLQGLVDLSAYTGMPIQVRFRGITGTSFTSDMAIDDVFFTSLSSDPVMVVNPTAIADTLLVGGSSTHYFNIANMQASPSTLNFTVTENPPVNWVSATPTSGTLTSLQNIDIAVDFDASQVTAGTYTTQLLVDGNDPQNPQVIVDVTLVANQAPVISITPDSVHFDLLTNEQDSSIFTISNIGNGPLQVVGIEDEEASVDDWTPSWTQPQKPSIFEAKGVDGAYRGEVTEGSGGPDPFGYKWIDSDDPNGPAYQWTDISGTGTVVTLLPTGTFDPKDEGMATLQLPWDIKFYGNNYNQIQVNSNGAIVLDMAFFDNMYTNVGIPNSADPNLYLAPFWDDLDGRSGGEIYYEAIGNMFIVQWSNWGHYSMGTESLDFQVVFFQNSATVWFVYEDMAQAQTDATVGIENGDGTIGLEISFDQAYVHSGLLTKISKGAEWLSEDPTTGTIQPGGTLDIKLKADAFGMLGGDYLANVIVSSNDPANPVVKLPKVSLTVTGQPDIQVTPKPLLFDTTLVGQAPTKMLQVDNIGTDDLTISNIESPDPVFTFDTTNFVLGPFSGQPVEVTFTPLLPGTYSGWIVVVSDDPDTPRDSTWVEAVAIGAPGATISPNYSNPVNVNLGDSVDISINVANTGLSDLVWSAQLSPVMLSPNLKPRTYGPVDASEMAEVSPTQTHSQGGYLIEAPWDLELSFDLQVATGALGNAGAEFDGNEFFTTRWASNLIHRYDQTGTMVEEFSIPGVSGLRDLAFDGTFMYGGAAANTIYQMDFVTKQLIGSIPSPVAVRHIAYDEANDAFWVGNWDTDIALVDRSGNQIGVIPAASHGLGGMYGSAYDSYTAGGPYLWVFDQGAGAGTPQLIHQFDLATGLATGFTYDVAADFAAAAPIAGGLWIGEGYAVGEASIGGVAQGTPDYFFVYELAQTAPPWLSLMETGGVVSAGDNHDVPLRVYGVQTRNDSMYVVFNTNDPGAPVVNVLVERHLVTGIEEGDALPTTFDVAQNYPNPFNPSTTIKYQLPQASDVHLVIYNVLGQKIRTLVNTRMEAGYHQAVWDGRNDTGAKMATGLYIFRFEAGDFQKVQKMLMMK